MKYKLATSVILISFIFSAPTKADDDIPSILKSIDSIELKYDEKQLVRGERFNPWDLKGAYKWIKDHGGRFFYPHVHWSGIYIIDPNGGASVRVASY